VNARRILRACFFAIEHSSRIFALVGVSTEAGHDHFRADTRPFLTISSKPSRSARVRFAM